MTATDTSDRSKAAVLARTQQAVELYLAGATFEQVAQQVGYSNKGTAYKVVTKALQERVTEDVPEARRASVARCDRMLRAWWPRALAGDEKAAKVVALWEGRRDRLLGLEAPQQHKVTMTTELDAEIESLVAQLQAGAGQAPVQALP